MNILITGGTGLLGKQLTQALLDKGHGVSHLSRRPGNDPRVKTFIWDVGKGEIDEQCINGVDLIIHLAGANVAEKRWTTGRKADLIRSRTGSIALIYALLRRKKHQVSKVISPSGTGYYGDNGDEVLTEAHPPAHDFLGECCIAWELAVDEGLALGIDTLKFRTGVVLTTEGGALPQLAMPVKLGIGSPLGSGKQWVSWIHHDDVINMYLYGIEHPELTGVFNMVAPHPVTNKQLTKAVAKALKRPLWLPNVPAFLIKLLFGEMATMVLSSICADAGKIEQAGFRFSYPDVNGALNEIYG